MRLDFRQIVRSLALLGSGAIALAVLGIALILVLFPSHTHRYRLTVEAEVGDDVRGRFERHRSDVAETATAW
jgi:hypothetical protein